MSRFNVPLSYEYGFSGVEGKLFEMVEFFTA